MWVSLLAKFKHLSRDPINFPKIRAQENHVATFALPILRTIFFARFDLYLYRRDQDIKKKKNSRKDGIKGWRNHRERERGGGSQRGDSRRYLYRVWSVAKTLEPTLSIVGREGSPREAVMFFCLFLLQPVNLYFSSLSRGFLYSFSIPSRCYLHHSASWTGQGCLTPSL